MNDLCADDATKLYYSNDTRFIPRGSATPVGDFTEDKRVEKLRYMHRNPVVRGLVEKPEDWAWSSFHHYSTGVEGTVQVESFWTG
jgi:hypothetical protein